MQPWFIAGIAAIAVGGLSVSCCGQLAVETVPVDCPAQTVGARWGMTELAFGAQVADETAQKTDFPLRYRYLAGSVPDPGCTSCQTCDIDGVSCENPDGCGWWGCWQDDNLPPGRIASDFVAGPQQASMITYYTWLSVSGGVEGQAEIDALTDGVRVERWLSDFRFAAQTLSNHGPVLVHMEPDLLGFLHKVNSDPSRAPVDFSGVPECAAMPQNAASLIPCWRELLSANAPNAMLGVHVSAWGAGRDLMRTGRGVDVSDHAERTVLFLQAAGLDADVLVIETSDRDAGFDRDGWTGDQPSLSRALEWAAELTDRTQIAHLWWQVPMGTPDLDNTCGRYVDDRVLQFVEHREEVARAGALGVAFGAGTECMTTAESDDGAFLRALAPALVDPPLLCGER